MKRTITTFSVIFAILIISTVLFASRSNSVLAQDEKIIPPALPADQPVQPLVIVDKVPDPFPNGCVSCHVDTGKENEDYRMNIILPALHPKHPKLSAIKTVPDDCKKCHTEGKKIGKLSQIVHKAHFGKGDDNIFLKEFGGKCLHCHSIDKTDWKMKPKSGPINW